MKPFKSFLSGDLEAFMRFRIQTGFKCSENAMRTILHPFDRYIFENQTQWEDFTPMFFLEFQRNISSGAPMTNKVMLFVRHFFDYLLRNDRVAQNPLADIDPLEERDFIPFIFAPEQIELLMISAHHLIRKKEKYFLYDLGVYTALQLLARCGLRITEPLKLRRSHFRTDDYTIYIEKTKFNKDRLIPIPLALASDIMNYRSAIESSGYAKDNAYLLAGFDQRSICAGSVYKMFHEALKQIRMNIKKEVIGRTTFASPTPHSLRHSFAVNSLQRVKQRGESAQNALPVLSVYMGHQDYRYTSKYLKLSDAGHRQALVDFCVKHRE